MYIGVTLMQDKLNKARLVEKIQLRKKILKYLRRTDYQRFMWLLQELQIRYVLPPEYYRSVGICIGVCVCGCVRSSCMFVLQNGEHLWLYACFWSIWVTFRIFIHLAGHLVGQLFCMAKLLTLNITCKLFNQNLSDLPNLQAQISAIILYHFSDLGCGWGWQSQEKLKPVGFMFLHSSQLVKFDVVLKHSTLSILMLLCRCYYRREITATLLIASKPLSLTLACTWFCSNWIWL